MKKLSISVIILALCVIIFPLSASAYEPFEIIDYDIVIDVHENNVLDFTEQIKVNFSEQRHGIVYEIPKRGDLIRVIDGEVVTKKYKSKVKKIKVTDHDYATNRYTDSIEIKIGDADELVIGEVVYNISYTVDMGDDGLDQFDDFYYNVIGQGWEVYIYDADITINMPKAFDSSKMEYYSGYSDTEPVNFEANVSGNSIHIDVTDGIPPYYGFTVRTELPEGYYVGERVPPDLRPLAYIISAGLLLLALVLFVSHGRDKKLFPIISFGPPKGITPADIGYIIDSIVDDKDVTSLIIYWAEKGFLEIEEVNKRTLKFIKLKQADSPMKKYEQYMFNELFDGREEVLTTDLTNTFYTITSKVKRKIRQQFNGETDLFTPKSKRMQAWLFFIMPIPVVFAMIACFIKDQNEGYIFWAIGLYVLLQFLFVPLNKLIKRWYSKRAIGRTFKIIFIIFVLLIGFLICMLSCQTDYLLGFVATLCSYIIGFAACFGKKRSDYAHDKMQEILGLKEFILSAEMDRINTLVIENPEYFYSVLPYAYVMGITEKWARRFETINTVPPKWYSSTTPYNTFSPMLFGRTMDSTMSQTQRSMTSAPSSSSSGGFSGSSGGFSGGGAGGSSGSSW